MAYFRGDVYVWNDEDGIHFWNSEGSDGWDYSGWLLDENEQRWPGYENASGVSVPDGIVEQFVMMRLAELLVHRTPEQIEKLIDEAVEVGNFGLDCLKKNAQVLKQAFRALKLERPGST